MNLVGKCDQRLDMPQAQNISRITRNERTYEILDQIENYGKISTNRCSNFACLSVAASVIAIVSAIMLIIACNGCFIVNKANEGLCGQNCPIAAKFSAISGVIVGSTTLMVAYIFSACRKHN